VSKFKVGDQIEGQNFTFSVRYNGMYGEVRKVGPIPCYRDDNGAPTTGDYSINWADGSMMACLEHQLKKRPDDAPFTSWFHEHILTDCRPTEETIKRTFVNGMWSGI
jgi:hypothetical protein